MPPFTCSSCSVMNRLSGDKGPHRRRLGRPNGTATLALRSPIDLRRARIVWVGSSGRARVQDRLRAQPFAQHLTISIAMFFKVSPTAGGQLVNSATEFIKPHMPEPPSARTSSDRPGVERARSRRQPLHRLDLNPSGAGASVRVFSVLPALSPPRNDHYRRSAVENHLAEADAGDGEIDNPDREHRHERPP
jgi:hypothetical protein